MQLLPAKLQLEESGMLTSLLSHWCQTARHECVDSRLLSADGLQAKPPEAWAGCFKRPDSSLNRLTGERVWAKIAPESLQGWVQSAWSGSYPVSPNRRLYLVLRSPNPALLRASISWMVRSDTSNRSAKSRAVNRRWTCNSIRWEEAISTHGYPLGNSNHFSLYWNMTRVSRSCALHDRQR